MIDLSIQEKYSNLKKYITEQRSILGMESFRKIVSIEQIYKKDKARGKRLLREFESQLSSEQSKAFKELKSIQPIKKQIENDYQKEKGKILLEEELKKKAENHLFYVPTDPFIQEHSNFIDMPMARYDRKPAKYYKQFGDLKLALTEEEKKRRIPQIQKANIVTYTIKDNSIEVGSKYGALTGLGNDVLSDGVPKFIKVAEEYTTVMFYEAEMLDAIGKPRQGGHYKELRKILPLMFSLTITYNKFLKRTKSKDGKVRSERVPIAGVSIFPTWVHNPKEKLWGAVLHPLFHKNMYVKMISDRVIKAIPESRSKTAYRVLDKAMGRKNWHKDNVDTICARFSIITDNPTVRTAQLENCLKAVKKGYAIADWQFIYKITDKFFYCRKSRERGLPLEEPLPKKRQGQKKAVAVADGKRMPGDNKTKLLRMIKTSAQIKGSSEKEIWVMAMTEIGARNEFGDFKGIKREGLEKVMNFLREHLNPHK